MRKILGVFREFQLFKYARHFTVLPRREEQETSIVLMGLIGLPRTTVGIVLPNRSLLRVSTFIKLPAKPSIVSE